MENLKKYAGVLYFAVEEFCGDDPDGNCQDECRNKAYNIAAICNAYNASQPFDNVRGVNCYSITVEDGAQLVQTLRRMNFYDGISDLERADLACSQVAYAFEFVCYLDGERKEWNGDDLQNLLDMVHDLELNA